jgi:hypothetical protein
MTKNQKIALGCGGAGCLGLIVVAVVGVVVWLVVLPGRTKREFNYNFSTNANSNSNTNSTPNVNASSNANGDNSNSSSSSSSEMSEDDKHRLYQAASMTGDPEMLRRVSVKLGLMNQDFTTSDRYLAFLRDHVSWALRNGDFISSLDTKEKAAAYVNEHFPE